ncbi:MAG: hypothetical protein KBT01_00970, partial [Clostridiales bacterium]|nr:hypothetical protein [Candidatus Blautia equi]
PASFLGPLCCALVLLFGTAYALLRQDKNRMISLLLTAFLVIAGLGSLGYYATVYETYSVPLTYTGKENILSDNVLNSQFLPVEGRLSTILDTGYIPETDALTVKLKRETAVSRTVTVQNGTASSSLVFPLFYYPNLNAYNKDGKPLVVSKTNEGKAVVRIPADYFGDVTIRYEIPSLWKQAGRLSFIFMILLIGGKLLLIYLQLPKDWFRMRLVIKPAAGENEKRI